MELKDFVKEALIQITEGVKESQVKIQELGGYANPAVHGNGSNDPSYMTSLSQGEGVFTVNFDIAVSVEEKAGTEGKGTLSVVKIFRFDAGSSSSESNATVSKITFKVPLALPVDPTSLERLQREDAEDKAEKEREARVCVNNLYRDNF